MGKPPTFIVKFESPNLDLEAEAENHAAPVAATKIVYLVMLVSIVVLFVVLGIGHMPRGG